MRAFRNFPARTRLAWALLPLLFIGAFHGTLPAQSELLATMTLAGLLGAGFWSDPCTWDGFATGIALGGCALGSLGACGGAIYSIWRAVKIDNCFS
jgi:hypothetical protein